MKVLLKILTIFVLVFWFVQLSNAWGLSDIIEWSKPKINVGCANSDCSLSKWTDLVKNTVNDIETDRSFSEYIQDIVFYLLTFLSLIAVLYIIYAWFNILTWGWEEEKNKKSKWIIVSVLVGIILIRLAYPIVLWMIWVLNA